MVNGGRCPSVGVSGFILGGGIGPFSRSYGMAVDNLIEVSIVTADGELYTVRRDDDQDSENDIGVRFLAYFDGNQDDFSKLIHKGVLNAELSKQLTRRSLPELSSRFLHETLFAQWDEETKRSTPTNTNFRIFHPFCFTNSGTEIVKITAIIKEELEAFKRLFRGEAAGLCQVSFIHAGGETTQRPSHATAFRWRDTIFHTYVMVQWKEKWLERDMRGFARKFKDRLRQFSIAGKAAFINFPDSSMPDTDHLKAYYGNNRQKLQQVKRLWDARNFWKWDQGIDLAESDSQAARDSADNNLEVKEEELSDGEEDAPDEQTDLAATIRWESRESTAAAPLLTQQFAALGMGWSHLEGIEALATDFFPT
ncbi:hypothetical protein SLS64_012726 [Diaporthe eres]